MESPRPTRRHEVNVFQALALLLAFLLLAVTGGVLTAGLLMPAVAAVGSVSGAAQQLFDDLPTEVEIVPPSERSVILAADGSTLATFYSENRVVVPLEEISPMMQAAVIATEDERFYDHAGVDTQGLMRAVFRTLQGDTQGASTLTQQYIKNVLIEEGRQAGDEEAIEAAQEADGAEGINRKLREMKLAISLEKEYTKDQILEGYLNIAQFAVGTFGVETAANYYFNKPAAELNAGESALIAGVTKSPTLYDPTRASDEEYTTATNRRDTVLTQMHAQGYITDEEYEEAIATPVAEMLDVTRTTQGCATAGISAYFCQYVTSALVNDGYLGETEEESRQALQRGGLTITTTIDLERQRQAHESLVSQIPANDPSYNSTVAGVHGVSGAISSVEPGTGNVEAMVQNTTYGQATDEDPRATTVNFNVDRAYGGGDGFQTGSTFKAFVLTQWLIDGHSLNETVDATNGQTFPFETWNISCSPSSASNFEPKNLEGAGGSNMTVLEATRQSVNTAYGYMANQMDLCDLRETTSKMGVHVGTGTINPDLLPEASEARALYEEQAGEDILAIPSMVLGSNTVAPLTMAAAFATYANEGVFCEPRAITAIQDRDGNEIEVPGSQCERALSEEITAGVNYALQEVVSPGATGAAAQIDRPVGGKTGTANDDWHAWFVGYTPQLSTAVWVGHSEGNISMFNTVINGTFYSQVYGGRLPAPIWAAYMNQALSGEAAQGFAEADDEQVYGEELPVPGVRGYSIANATAMLEEAGFRVQIGSNRYGAMPIGTVETYSPSGVAIRNSTITLYPSAGPAPAPPPEPDPEPSEDEGGDDDGGGNEGGRGNGGGDNGGGGDDEEDDD